MSENPFFDDVGDRRQAVAKRRRLFETALTATREQLDQLIVWDRWLMQQYRRRNDEPPPLAHRLDELRAIAEARGIDVMWERQKPSYSPVRTAASYKIVAASGVRDAIGVVIDAPAKGDIIQIGDVTLRVRRWRREQDDLHLRVVAPPAQLRLEPIFDDEEEEE